MSADGQQWKRPDYYWQPADDTLWAGMYENRYTWVESLFLQIAYVCVAVYQSLDLWGWVLIAYLLPSASIKKKTDQSNLCLPIKSVIKWILQSCYHQTVGRKLSGNLREIPVIGISEGGLGRNGENYNGLALQNPE